MIYYCQYCAMQYKLPLNNSPIGDNLVAGFCCLCGTAGIYVGKMTNERFVEKGIKIPTKEELANIWLE